MGQSIRRITNGHDRGLHRDRRRGGTVRIVRGREARQGPHSIHGRSERSGHADSAGVFVPGVVSGAYGHSFAYPVVQQDGSPGGFLIALDGATAAASQPIVEAVLSSDSAFELRLVDGGEVDCIHDFSDFDEGSYTWTGRVKIGENLRQSWPWAGDSFVFLTYASDVSYDIGLTDGVRVVWQDSKDMAPPSGPASGEILAPMLLAPPNVALEVDSFRGALWSGLSAAHVPLPDGFGGEFAGMSFIEDVR